MDLFPKVDKAGQARNLAGRSMLGGLIFFFLGMASALVVEFTSLEFGLWPLFTGAGAVSIAQGFYFRTLQWRLEDQEAGAVVG